MGTEDSSGPVDAVPLYVVSAQAPEDAVPMDAVEAAAKAAARLRRARFGALPARIAPADMVEEQPATPKAGDGYVEEQAWLHYGAALGPGF